MTILGINAYHGDAAAALVVDGELVAAVEEERFNRIKHWADSRGAWSSAHVPSGTDPSFLPTRGAPDLTPVYGPRDVRGSFRSGRRGALVLPVDRYGCAGAVGTTFYPTITPRASRGVAQAAETEVG